VNRKTSTRKQLTQLLSLSQTKALLGDNFFTGIAFFADNSVGFGRQYMEATNHIWFHVALLFAPPRQPFQGLYFECTSGKFHPGGPSGWTGPRDAASLSRWRNADQNNRQLSVRDLLLSQAESDETLRRAWSRVGHIRYAELSLIRMAIGQKTGIWLPSCGRTPHWATCSEAVALMLPARLRPLLLLKPRDRDDDVYPSGGPGANLWDMCSRIALTRPNRWR